MKKYLTPVMAAGVVLVGAGLVWAGASVSGLDKEKLRNGIADRIESAVNQKRPDADVELGPSDVKLQRVQPTSVSIHDAEIPLYAIKASVSPPAQNKGEKPSTVKMVVDQKGELQLSVKEVSSGTSLVQNAKDVVRSKEINPEWGHTVFEGEGSKNVLLVSDPFCGYCRKAVNWFLDHRENIGKLKVMHVPYSRRVGGDVASWAFTDGVEDVEAGQLLRFIYTDLEPLEKGAPKEDRKKILKQVMQEFPALKKRWGTPERGYYYLKGKFDQDVNKEKQIAQNKLGVRATPGVFVDGIPVKGWNPQRYGELLALKNKE